MLIVIDQGILETLSPHYESSEKNHKIKQEIVLSAHKLRNV